MLYSELQCSEAIHKAVERMGFAEMTEIQEKTIPVMLAGGGGGAAPPPGRGLPNDDTAKSFRRVAADSRVGCLSGFLLGTATP